MQRNKLLQAKDSMSAQ